MPIPTPARVLMVSRREQFVSLPVQRYTVDICSAGQFAERTLSGGGMAAGSEEDDCGSFETLVAQQGASGVPISAMLGDGVPGVDATPLQSAVLNEPKVTLEEEEQFAASIATAVATESEARTGGVATTDASHIADMPNRSPLRKDVPKTAADSAMEQPLPAGRRALTDGLRAPAAAEPQCEEKLPAATEPVG